MIFLIFTEDQYHLPRCLLAHPRARFSLIFLRGNSLGRVWSGHLDRGVPTPLILSLSPSGAGASNSLIHLSSILSRSGFVNFPNILCTVPSLRFLLN